MTNRILRLPDVKDRSGLGRSTIYRRIAENTFPKPIRIGERAVGWLESEIDAWTELRTRERDACNEGSK